MGIFEKLSEIMRLKRERKILDRIDAKTTEYRENSINGEIVNQDILIDGESVKTSLNAKEKYIKAYAQAERIKRENQVAKAEKAGDPMTAMEVKKLRDMEDLKRFEALKHIKEMVGRS